MNLARIALVEPGQDWRDLPKEMLPGSMQRALRKDHTRRYRRMTWDGVPRAVITRFRDPKSGEYTHPAQNRTITIREAARLQGFPDRFVFHGDRSSQYDQVGNAVPVPLAEAIAGRCSAMLRRSPLRSAYAAPGNGSRRKCSPTNSGLRHLLPVPLSWQIHARGRRVRCQSPSCPGLRCLEWPTQGNKGESRRHVRSYFFREHQEDAESGNAAGQ